MSLQLAPFNAGYNLTTGDDATTLFSPRASVNEYRGALGLSDGARFITDTTIALQVGGINKQPVPRSSPPKMSMQIVLMLALRFTRWSTCRVKVPTPTLLGMSAWRVYTRAPTDGSSRYRSIGGQPMWRLGPDAVAPDPRVEIGRRPIPEEVSQASCQTAHRRVN